MTIRDLLRNALRMRPDRIVIGEVRGAEALDLLTALNTGHDGALSTVHANSPADALARLETLALMAGLGLPHEAIADQVRRGIDLVVQLERRADGARRVVEIAEVAWLILRRAPLAGGAGGARRAARRCWRARRPAPGCGWRWSRCGGPGARATRPRPWSAAGSPRSAPRGALLGGWFLAGPSVGAAARRSPGPGWPPGRSPAAAGATAGAVERALPEVAAAVADSLAAGRSLRASLPAAATSLDGPAAVELARLGAELDLGAPTADAVEGWRRRMRSPRVDAFAAALLSQRLAGGDLAGLLRRFAEGAAERDRVADDARSATAQARFTGLLVVAMPSGGAVFAELIAARLRRQGDRARRPRPSSSRSPRRCRSPASSRSAASRGWSE